MSRIRDPGAASSASPAGSVLNRSPFATGWARARTPARGCGSARGKGRGQRRAGADRRDDLLDASDRSGSGADVLEEALVGGVHGATDGAGGERGELVMRLVPTLSLGAGAGGGENSERTVTERGERLGLREDATEDRNLVTLAPIALRGGGEGVDRRGVAGRQV